MTRIIASLFLILSALDGVADTQKRKNVFDGLLPNFSLSRIEKGLQVVLDSEHLLPLEYPVEEEEPLNVILDVSLRSAFQNVIHTLSQLEDKFSMEAHQLKEGMAYCDVKKMVIRVDPEQFSILFGSSPFNSEELTLGLEFIVAHEISHYLQLLYVEKISNNKKTPSGLSFDDYSSFESEFKSADPYDIIRGFLIAGGRKIYELHAEVDLFALSILKKMGRSETEVHKAVEVAQYAFFTSKNSRQLDLNNITLDNLHLAFEAIEGKFRLETIIKTVEQTKTKN